MSAVLVTSIVSMSAVLVTNIVSMSAVLVTNIVSMSAVLQMRNLQHLHLTYQWLSVILLTIKYV
jgi:hypothetical protein